jgi:hypothetical protein
VTDVCWNRTYLTGFATQDTYWNEGPGGNVTAWGNGKNYTRADPWMFQITRMVA